MGNILLSNLINPTKAKYSQLNEVDYFDLFYNSFMDLSLSMFEWINLPDSCNEKYLEEGLFSRGKMGFVYDDKTGEIYSLNIQGTDNVNMYGLHDKYTVTSIGGTAYNEIVDADEVVVVFNNKLKKSTSDLIFTNTIRLANLSMTIDVNINAQKTPILIEADDDTINSLKTVYNNITSNVPVTFVKKATSGVNVGDSIKAHSTGAEFTADRLLLLQHDIYNDTLTRIGVNNTALEKKERLITSEADANMMQIAVHLYSMYDERKKACDEFNKKFNPEKKLDVKIRDYETFMRMAGMLKDSEVVTYGKLDTSDTDNDKE